MADAAGNQIVQFSEYEGRDDARRCRGDQCRDGTAVQRFVGVERGVEPSRIQAFAHRAMTGQVAGAIGVSGEIGVHLPRVLQQRAPTHA